MNSNEIQALYDLYIKSRLSITTQGIFERIKSITEEKFTEEDDSTYEIVSGLGTMEYEAFCNGARMAMVFKSLETMDDLS